MVFFLHFRRVEFERSDDVDASLFESVPVGCPRTFFGNFFFRTTRFHGRQHDFFHHLTDDTIGKNHGRVAIFESKFKSQVHEVCHLLHRSGSKHNDFIVSISTAARRLIVVTLRGLNGSKSGTSSLDIDDETGDFGTCHIADSFLHQRDAGRGGGSHDSFSRSATSVEHVDGCHFALCLQHNHSGGFPRLNFGKRFEHFALRRDGIAKVAVTATSDGGVGNGFVSFQKENFFIHWAFQFFCDRR